MDEDQAPRAGAGEREEIPFFETRDFLAAIVASSDDAIVGKTLDGVIRSWNRGAERTFGYTAEEAIGRPITLIIPTDRHHEERDILARLRRGERIDHFETIRLHKNGSLMRISLSVSPIHDATGKVVGASKVARKLTDEELVERALRESEDRFRTLADNIAQFAWMADPNGAIFWYNKRWFDYTGTTLEEMAGWGWQKVHHPDTSLPSSPSSEMRRARQAWEDTFPLRSRDGRLPLVPVAGDSDPRPRRRGGALVRHQHRHHRANAHGGGAARGRSAQGRVPRDARSRAAQPVGADRHRLRAACGSPATTGDAPTR